MKARLSIYNTIMMSVLVAMILFFMISISGSVVKVSSKATLKSIVTENAKQIDFDDHILDFDDIDFYEDHVTTLVYSTDGVLLAGSIKDEIMEPLINGQMKSVSQGEESYLIYDFLATSSNEDSIYLRGIISTSSVTNMLNNIFIIALLAFPLFIILSAIGSYIICQQSLKPLEKMVSTAEQISQSDDLSLRIGTIKGKDEISRLAITFDKMLERLEKVINAEKQFTSDVSHELRTPTAVILAECEMYPDASIEENAEALHQIKSQALKIKDLINHLLNMIRLENGTLKPELSEIDMTELVEEFCIEKKETMSTHVSLHVDCQPNIVMMSDYAMLLRILTNLVENSEKYIGTGSKIEVKLYQDADHIKLSVTDDGIGIDKQNHESVFHRFYRVDKSRTEKNSMGLGLSMVKQMVELLGGNIFLESELSKGSKFEIVFKKDKR